MVWSYRTIETCYSNGYWSNIIFSIQCRDSGTCKGQNYTGVKWKIPPGQIGSIRGLPSLAVTQMLNVTPMTLDQSYPEQIILILPNYSDKMMTIEASYRLATLALLLQSWSEIQLVSLIKAKTKETKAISANGKACPDILNERQNSESSVPPINPTPESKGQPNPIL